MAHRRGEDQGWQWYPVLFVAAFVLDAWREADVPADVLWRPLVIAIGVTVVAMLGIGLVLPQRRSGMAVAIVTAVVVLAAEPTLNQVLGRLEPAVVPAFLALLASTLAVAAAIGWRLWRRPGATEHVSRALSGVGVLLLAVITFTSWIDGSLQAAAREMLARSQPSSVTSTGSSSAQRDVYLILLDGYPRADALHAIYGLDNSPFLNELARRGLTVSGASGGNYLFTQHTFASMLNFRHIPELVRELGASELPLPDAMRLAVSHNEAFGRMRDLGYEVVTVSAGYESVGLGSADRVIDTGQLSEFERHLLRRTHLIDVLALTAPDWLPDQLRDRVHDTLRSVQRIASEESVRPRFVLAHIPSPHSPNLFRADGSPQDVKDLRTFHADSPQATGWSEEEFAHQVREQVTYLNSLVLGMLDELMEATSGEAVIVLMSDHGLRMTTTFGNPDDPNLWERYATLFAAYTPDHDDLFGDRVTNINVLPILLNAYASAELDCLPDHAYANGTGGFLDLHRVPQYDGASPEACGQPAGS